MTTFVLAVVIGVVIIVAAIFIVGQRMLIELNKATLESTGKNKKEVESSVKNMLDDNQKLLAQITRNLERQLDINRKDVGDIKNQNAAIREQLEITSKVTEGLHASTEGLKNLLSNNRLRGDWGEQIAEDLLIAAGFVEKLNYIKQSVNSSGRPDFTILLPEGYKLNIDAKFPFDDLFAYQAADNNEDKKKALRNFKESVKNKIKDISDKGYINPEEQTLDFVIMFIPNEMIFSFIYETVPDITQFAIKNKVILAGPYGFTAVLRMVQQAHRSFHHEKNLMKILGLISKFQEEYEKFGSSLSKLGKQIETTMGTFNEVETTRSRQLTKVVNQISEHTLSSIESGHDEQPKQIVE